MESEMKHDSEKDGRAWYEQVHMGEWQWEALSDAEKAEWREGARQWREIEARLLNGKPKSITWNHGGKTSR